MLRGLVSIPLDVAGLIGRLPQLARRLDELAEATQALPRMLEEIRAVKEDARTLPAMDQVLAELLQRLLASLDQLDENVGSLHGAVQPLGRIAERLPGSRRPGGATAAT